MTLAISIPRVSHDSLAIEMQRGEVLFLLGANGAGKSSLMQFLSNANGGKVERLLAHRQTWFHSLGLSLSPASYTQNQNQLRYSDTQPETRWSDNQADSRSQLILYRLTESHNRRARSIAAAHDTGDEALARSRANEDAPLLVTNRLLRAANLAVEIQLDDEGALKASKAGSPAFSYAQLSDGERNALVILASVLTAPEDTLFLIDEPERHLHRSIISPLLTQLFALRPDCYFIISTHDVELPLDAPASRTLLARSVFFQGETPAAWEIDIMHNSAPLDEALRRDILGARRSILFVEGIEGSLDMGLYSLLFPQISVVPKSSCRAVEHAVRGIRSSGEFHWVNVFGIVDNDNRPETDLAALQADGIYPLSVYSVESIYYHPQIIRLVAERLGAAHGFNAGEAAQQALDGILRAVTNNVPHLTNRVVDRRAREQVLRHLPTIETVKAAVAVQIAVDIPALLGAEQIHLTDLIDRKDVAALVARYPIRETPAFAAVARALGLSDRQSYEATVRAMMADTPGARTTALGLFSTLPNELSPTPSTF